MTEALVQESQLGPSKFRFSSDNFERKRLSLTDDCL